MEIPTGVSTFQGRLDSFSIDHHLSKRRASSAKKRTPQTVSWPHKSPRPEELARAGFFYKPTGDSNDNCMCFVCHRQLDGWEEGDDPIVEHLKHAPDCGWAIHASITETFKNGGQVTDDPMCEQLAQSRADTFGEHWPYEQKKGWKCRVTKMVAAGWCYDPSPEYDDGVSCSYCNLSLDGWERNDDPFVEHQRRAPDCDYFKLLDEWSAAREQVKGKKANGRASRGSKASRLSTQSMVSTMSEVPSQLSLGDEPAGEDDSILATATNTTAKGRKKAKATTAKGKGRGAIGKGNNSLAVDDLIMMHRKSSVPIEVEPVIQEPPKRQTRRIISRNEISQNEDTLNPSQVPKPTRTKATRGKAKHRLTEDESQLQAELQASIEESLIEREQTPRPTRGVKRMSNGVLKQDSSVTFLEEALAEMQEKPKRGRKPKNQAPPEMEAEEQNENAGPRALMGSEVSQRVSSVPARGPKSKKGKKGAKPALVEPEPEDEEMQDFNFVQSLVNPVNPYQFMEGTPEPPADEASPTPSTPTPARVRPRSSSAIRQSHAATPLGASASRKKATPTPSPQSSDAENKPPSSRPESLRPSLSIPCLTAQPVFSPQAPASTRRDPLSERTPAHVNRSPSKRNMLGGIRSDLPWAPTALENVFLNSPVKANLATKSSIPGQENVASMFPNINLETADLRHVVGAVKYGMSDAEKKMSVGEWIRYNAKMAEEKLRSECEDRVMMFEKEGGRALRSLEGIECME